MKKIYFIISLMLSFILLAASGGVGENQNRDRSGSPDGDNPCSQCHSSGAFSPQVNLTVADADGNQVTSYIPGENYFLSYSVSGTGSSSYGFQSTVLTAANENAGTFINAGTQVQIETVSNANVTNRSVVEQSSPSSSGEFSAEWTAPTEGTGEVTFYFSGVAVNGNGLSSGDGYVGGTLNLAEDTDSSVEYIDASELKVTLLNDELILKSEQNQLLENVLIYNLSGQVIFESSSVQLPLVLGSSEIARGVNVIQVASDQAVQTFKVLN